MSEYKSIPPIGESADNQLKKPKVKDPKRKHGSWVNQLRFTFQSFNPG